MSRIPEENIPISDHAYMDGVIFNLMVLVANTLVLGLLSCKMLFPLLFFPLSVYQSFVRSGTELNAEVLNNYILSNWQLTFSALFPGIKQPKSVIFQKL